MSDKNKLAVLGIGNPLCRDDGIGIRIIELMRESHEFEDIVLIDGGSNPDLFSLLDENTDSLIIIDAVKGGGTPGSIYRLAITDDNVTDDLLPSLHGLGLLDSLRMMKKLNIRRPPVTIVGIEPQDVSYGLGLSPLLKSLLPAILEAVAGEIKLH
ncbi:MAG: hydrogenase maturation protease [Dehalococcoidia bacterium]|nr:hydrogenase maturation protease [Dehalococcoidia bacterium]